MKLIECNIAGFGTFNDFKLSFDEGLNVILQPNGWARPLSPPTSRPCCTASTARRRAT